MNYYFRHRLLFGYGGIGVGILVAAFGVYGLLVADHLIEQLIVALFVLIAAVLSTSMTGAGLSAKEGRIFRYYSFLGLRLHGKKTSLTDFSCIVILRYRITWVNYSRATQSSRKEEGYSVTLASSDHRKKYDLALCDSMTSAQNQAEVISRELDMPILKYNPHRITRRR